MDSTWKTAQCHRCHWRCTGRWACSSPVDPQRRSSCSSWATSWSAPGPHWRVSCVTSWHEEWSERASWCLSWAWCWRVSWGGIILCTLVVWLRGPVRLTLTDRKQLKALTAAQQTDFNYNHQTNKIVFTDLVVMNVDYKQLRAWRARAKLGLTCNAVWGCDLSC